MGQSKYSQEVADAICERLSRGQTLRQAVDGTGVAASTVLLWVDSRPEFAEQYARARNTGYRLLADEILEISDDSRGDVIVDEDGNERTDQERVARARLRVDSRKWLLSKMLPKVYGDKLDLNHSGEVAVSWPVAPPKIERERA